MSGKIKSTLNFVKIWPLENRREVTPFTIISDSQVAANAEVSKTVEAWNSIETDSAGNVIYQCYLKNVITEEFFYARTYQNSTGNMLNDEQVLQFIIDNKVSLVPTTQKWETETGEPATFVTHDVIVDEHCYQGMSVQDCINKHLNKV